MFLKSLIYPSQVSQNITFDNIPSVSIYRLHFYHCFLLQRRRTVITAINSNHGKDEEFLKFAIDNLDELLSYIAQGNLNIRIHRDITGEMWFGIG